MTRLAKLSRALEQAKADEIEARTVGFTMCAGQPIFYAEAVAIRKGMEDIYTDALHA